MTSGGIRIGQLVKNKYLIKLCQAFCIVYNYISGYLTASHSYPWDNRAMEYRCQYVLPRGHTKGETLVKPETRHFSYFRLRLDTLKTMAWS